MASGAFSSLSNTNYSIYALPIYYIISIVPHAYAIRVATHGNIPAWDNRNPRAANLKRNLYSTLDPETYAQYERAEAAHYNCNESLPLFASAVVLGNIAHMPLETLNTFVMGYIALRVAYIGSYIGISNNSASYARSGLWFASVGWCLRVLWRAGKLLA